MPKLAVCIPWHPPFVYRDFVVSAMSVSPPDGYEMEPIWSGGWCSAARHNNGTDQALKWGADVILFMDADQTFNRDAVQRLIHRMDTDKRDVMAAVVPQRGYVASQPMEPFQSMAWRLKDPADLSKMGKATGWTMPHKFMDVIDPDEAPVQQVNLVSTSFFAIRTSVFPKLSRPWFFECVDPRTWNRYSNMDTAFVLRLQKEAGVSIWVDTTIPIEHRQVFGIDRTFPGRFKDWADGGGDPRICSYNKE